MHRATITLYVACAVIWLGDLLHIIGVLTPHWQDFKHKKFRSHKGLFRKCVASGCFDVDESRSRRACQAFMITAAITGLLGGVLLATYVILKLMTSWSPPRFITYMSTYVCVASFFCSLIGIIIYAVDLKFPVLGWGPSFGLCLAGAFLTGIGGALVIASNRMTSRNTQWTPESS